MEEAVCAACRGFGKVHPVPGGKIDYGCLVFCSCLGEKALKTAHPPVKHPDTGWDITDRRLPDGFDRARQLRYRRSEAFKSELKEATKDDPCFHCPEDILGNQPRKDSLRELIGLHAEVNKLKKILMGPQQKTSPTLKNGGF